MIEATALTIKEGVAAIAKELPKFAEGVTFSTKTMEEANMPIYNTKDYLAENIESKISLKCINQHLAGQAHEDTGIEYKTRNINHDGLIKEVVVPDFDTRFDARLREDQLLAPDNIQIRECNSQLQEAIRSNPELKAQFTDLQIEMIEDGHTPRGFTWHHDAEPGLMQLVSSDIHSRTPHTGGRAIWGGGQDFR